MNINKLNLLVLLVLMVITTYLFTMAGSLITNDTNILYCFQLLGGAVAFYVSSKLGFDIFDKN